MKDRSRLILRTLLVLAVVASVSLYSVGVFSGSIPKDRRLDLAHLGLLVLAGLCVAFLIRPETFRGVSEFSAAGVGFKREVEEVQERQDQQESRLKDIDLILPLLLPEEARKHLENLAQGAAPYVGQESLRTELRRLSSLNLIEMKDEKTIEQMENGSRFELADYVRLTPLGEQWVARLEQLRHQEPPPERSEEGGA